MTTTKEIQVRSTALVATDSDAFHQKKTTMFYLTGDYSIDPHLLIRNRLGFKEKSPIQTTSNLSFGPRQPGLVVSEDTQDVYPHIQRSWLQKKLKLEDLAESYDRVHGHRPCDGDLTWDAWFNLPVEDRVRCMGSPISALCQKERKSEAKLLGYTHLTPEQFYEQYHVHTYKEQVVAFPKVEVTCYGISSTNTTHIDRYLLWEDIPEAPAKLWLVQAKAKAGMERTYLGDENNYNLPDLGDLSPWMLAAPILLETSAGKSFFSHIPYTYVFPPKDKETNSTFSITDVQALAKELDIKNITGKNKAELCIMIGEVLSTQKPRFDKPSLVFYKGEGNIDACIPDIEPWTQDIKAYKDSANLSIEDYFGFVTRVVSRAAYAPLAPGSPASRIPTDGNFPRTFCVEPLNIFE